MTTPDRPATVTAVDFYTRPGCGFSVALRRRLERRGIPLLLHDIWSDPDAAQRVRRAAHGAETVPTVGVGPLMLVNPRATDVVTALESVAPHLVPAPVTSDASGLRARLARWRSRAAAADHDAASGTLGRDEST